MGGVSSDQMLLAHPVVCIVGPTASGKSDAAQIVAACIDGEVLSADSMQIYRGMDIGTGKVPVSDRIVAHHGIDLVDPGEPYSASLYQAYARETIRDIDSRGKTCVLCGGTGFYVRAALDGYEFPQGEQVDNPVRSFYTAYAEEHGADALWRFLVERDPESAAVIHPNNVRRVVRAFEMIEDGTSYARQLSNLSAVPQVVPARFFGLSVDRDVLNDRIERRVDAMVEAGLVDEVRGLIDAGFEDAVCAQQAIGYKEIARAFEGSLTIPEAIADIKRATRRYAKRQRTWFKKDARICWIDATNRDAESIASEICDRIAASENPL